MVHREPLNGLKKKRRGDCMDSVGTLHLAGKSFLGRNVVHEFSELAMARGLFRTDKAKFQRSSTHCAVRQCEPQPIIIDKP